MLTLAARTTDALEQTTAPIKTKQNKLQRKKEIMPPPGYHGKSSQVKALDSTVEATYISSHQACNYLIKTAVKVVE